MRLKLSAIILVFCLLPGYARADAALLDGAQLGEHMKAGELCCVIDAREEGRRKQRPIPFAVTYQKGLKLAPGGFAVVVADGDAKALTIAEALAANAGKPVYAVKGGYDVWRLTPEGLARASAPRMSAPRNFVIPSDTCKQGSPLQEFK
jgi:hypothetical protein